MIDGLTFRWDWHGELRICRRGVHSSAGETLEMTEWIDRVVVKLGDAEKAKNLQNAVYLAHLEVIEGRAPKFFDGLFTAAQELTHELNEKLGATLGGVMIAEIGGGFNVTSRGGRGATVIAKLNPKARQIDAKIKILKPGIMVGENPESLHEFKFKVDGDSEMFVQGEDGQRYFHPKDVASTLLERAFAPLFA